MKILLKTLSLVLMISGALLWVLGQLLSLAFSILGVVLTIFFSILWAGFKPLPPRDPDEERRDNQQFSIGWPDWDKH